MLERLARALGRLCARRPILVLAVGAVLTALSGALALRIEVKTAFKDLLDADDPHVKRLTALSESFPGAVTVQVLIEGNDAERMIATAHQLERGFLEQKDTVRAVYLEQEVDFFARRALLYLEPDQLRRLDALVARHQGTLAALLADPSSRGVLDALERVTTEALPSKSTAITLKTRLSADVLLDALLAGNPAADVGVRVDPGPAAKKLREQGLDLLDKSPLPPSEAQAQQALRAIEAVLALVADQLDEGDKLGDDELRRRVQHLIEVDLSQTAAAGALPGRYLFSADKRLLMMEVAAQKDATLLENIRPLLASLKPVVDDARRASPDIQIGLTGLPVMYAEEQDAIMANFLLGSILGLLGILAIVIIGFQQVSMPLVSTIPLFMGVLWAFGIQGAVSPELNMLNLLFPIVLFGLGTDYAIQLLNSYLARRGAGDDPEQAAVHTLEELMPGIFVGATTTAVAFYILMLAQMKGLRDLGFTAGTGVMAAVVSMCTMLPPMLVLFDKHVGIPASSKIAPSKDTWLYRLGAFVERRRYPVFAAFLFLTCVAGNFLPNVGFETDATRVQPVGMPANELQKKMLSAFHITGDPSIFLAKDLAEAERITEQILKARTLAPPLSITLALPKGQQQKRPLIEALRKTIDAAQPKAPAPPHDYGAAEVQELRKHLASLKGAVLEASAVAPLLYGEDTRLALGRVRDLLNRIDQRIDVTEAHTLQVLDARIADQVRGALALAHDMTEHTSVGVDDVPRSITERVVAKDGRVIVIVRPNAPPYAAGFLDAHVDELEAISKEVTGTVPVWRELLRQILSDLPRLSLYVAVAIALLVLIGLRSLKALLIGMVPLCVGLLWLIGGMGALGVDFNFVSVLCLPILLGTGIDYGVYLIERIRHDRDVGGAVGHSGRALALTAATTTVGFGSLMLSAHRGVFWLGLLTSIGILACLLVTLVLLPALVSIFAESWTKPEPEPAAPPQQAPPPEPTATTTTTTSA